MIRRATIAALTLPLCAILAAAQDPQPAPPEPAVIFAESTALFESGRMNEAIDGFMAVAKSPGAGALAPLSRFMQAKALAASARFEDAIVILDAFLKMAPDSPFAYEALMLRGKSLVAASAVTPHFKEAAISFSMALENEGASPAERTAARAALIDSLLRTGETEYPRDLVSHLTPGEFSDLAAFARSTGGTRVTDFMEGIAQK